MSGCGCCIMNPAFQNQSRPECLARTDEQICKDRLLINTSMCIFDRLDFREQCLGTPVRIKVRLICSYHRLPPEHCPSGSALIIKKTSLYNQVSPKNVCYLQCSCIPKAQTPLTPDDHSSSPRICCRQSTATAVTSQSNHPLTPHAITDVRGI